MKIKNYKKFLSSDENVSKYVFEGDDIAVESVLYRYNTYKERTVICCSTQCGCPVGCTFCGTGSKFYRNLTSSEIVYQVDIILSEIDCDPIYVEKLQIMFMSMGEPFLNYSELAAAIKTLHKSYPNAELLVSTSAPKSISTYWEDFIELSKEIDKIGIQFSIHESTDEARAKLIPTKTSTLIEIAKLGETWAKAIGRKPFFNYCVHKENSSSRDVLNLAGVFNPDVWEATFSVICEKDQTMAAAIQEQLILIDDFSEMMKERGFSYRIFNPAGQDDIGGGCGQLWYFQEWRENHE